MKQWMMVVASAALLALWAAPAVGQKGGKPQPAAYTVAELWGALGGNPSGLNANGWALGTDAAGPVVWIPTQPNGGTGSLLRLPVLNGWSIAVSGIALNGSVVGTGSSSNSGQSIPVSLR